eukprot:5055919-Amphidinium_carterae.1
MVISINLLADSGIVPSRSSEFASVRRRQTHIVSSSIMYTKLRAKATLPENKAKPTNSAQD